MAVLTAIDIMGVQRFIFSSNRLRDVVTGSFLVHWSTARDGALCGLLSDENILLAAGGNAIFEFGSREEAHAFTASYSRRLYDQAPGIDAVVVHKAFEKGGLVRAIEGIRIELERVKTERLPAAPLLGLSVNASCSETGLPAVGFDKAEPTVPLSTGILSRRKRTAEATEHWSSYLEGKQGFAFPMELDHLGRSRGDTSLIGVVHVDGNGVGQKINTWLSERSGNGVDDDTVRQEYREWSQAIDSLGKASFQAVVDRVFHAIAPIEGKEILKITGIPEELGFELKMPDGKWLLPLRPILLGGDDLTFICDGRIALDLATAALSVFEGSNVVHLGKITASAGVAMVRTHAPFRRAYELAEGLCASAKHMLKQKNKSECALDWHIGTIRPGETVESIRGRQYHKDKRRLTCRPYYLGSGKDAPETWRWLSETLLDDEDVGLRGKRWAERRNKVKAFPELVRQGGNDVKSALESWRIVDRGLKLPQPIAENGFRSDRTPLIDAVELLNLHLALTPKGRDRRKETP
jgi:hypothetical protein